MASVRGSRAPGLLLALPVLAFLLLPTLIVVPVALSTSDYLRFPPQGLSLRAVRGFLDDPGWTAAALASLQVALWATAIGLAVGAPAAVAMHRRSFFGKGLLTAVLLAPMIVPAIVMALAFYRFYLAREMTGSLVPIAIAHGVMATPFVFLTVQASLSGLDPALVRSARSCGAGSVAVARHVYLPVIRPGLVAGALFAFSVSVDETVVAIFLQGPEATTLPVKMFTDIQYNLSPKIAVSSALLVSAATLALLVQVLVMLRRRSASSLLPLPGRTR
jgi:putative spermidine/putrescine transport system permease protein